jgi:hypothetical protein
MSIFALEDVSRNIFSLLPLWHDKINFALVCRQLWNVWSVLIAETLYIRNRIELRDGQLLKHLATGALRRITNLHIVFEADNMTSKIIQQFESLLSSLESLQNVHLDEGASNR